MVQITVDVESDFGGRSNSTQGIEEAIPFILECLEHHGLKATFFLSTEYLDSWVEVAKTIQSAGHTLGSHGHEHRRFRKWLPWRLDYLKSMQILEKQLGLKRPIPYRAPWFSYQHPEHRYSDRRGHTSLLRHVWFKEPMKEILYCHPFDFVKPLTKAPSLFTEVLYSSSEDCRKVFENVLLLASQDSPA